MKRGLPAGLLAVALSGAVSAAVLWQEDFSCYDDVGVTGAGYSGGYPAAVTNWSLDVSPCTLADAADYFMAVDTSGGRMEAKDIDGEALWSSAVIDLGGYTNISLSVDTSETGSSSSASKYVQLYYRLNGGAETAFAVSPTNTGNWGSATATHSHLYGDTVQIIARVNNPNAGDAVIFDNVTVSGDALSANAPPVLAPIGNRSLTVSNALSFTVTATDADLDRITLSASNLPPGAVFNTVTHAGSVTNTFTWTCAAPAGVYTPTFYATDGSTGDVETICITVTNAPVVSPTGAAWTVTYNLPQQSGTSYPDQYRIRDALVERINALQSGNSATLTTYTFSAEEGAGAVMNAMAAALDRGALIRFVADGEISIGTVYGGTHSLLSLSTRAANPLTLAVDGSSSGILHDKLGLFDYGGTNQWVFTASWNFTEAASVAQWNIALETRSPELYAIYTNETAEFFAGHFHDDPAKSHAHDGSTFTLDGSWGPNEVRFAPYPDSTQGGNNAERDITNLIAQAQSKIVFALNKLNREPIRDALISAANRGVLIQGVMPKSDTDPGNVSAGIYSNLTHIANDAVQMLPAYSAADYSTLDAGEADLIHAKYMVIDPESPHAIVIHGSANWTYEGLVSQRDNDENTVFLRHNEIAEQFYENFQRITGTGRYAGGNSTLVEWNFDDNDPVADGGISANATQQVVRVCAPASYSYTDQALSAASWDNGAGTAYWETSFSTLQHTQLMVSSKQTSTSTGPAEFQLQYKIGASGTYADVPGGTLTADTGWNAQLTRLALPDACANQTHVFLRWLMTRNIAVNGNPVGSTGASRIDDILISGTAYDMPPELDPIGSKTGVERETLSFTVTADDSIDHDAITLSATNLPTGAVFTNGVFTWSNAAPAAVYSITFIATDKDGADRETIQISVTERPDLFISEIADPFGTGADAYRFVELYNAGTHAIDLSAGQWTLCKQVNGGTWYDVPLTGTVASASAWVIAYSATDFQDAYGFAPNQESSTVSGNGDDAYFLYASGTHTNGTLIDLYGERDTDGTDTLWDYEDSCVVRNDNLLQPNAVWTVSEWTITAGAEPGDMTPGAHGPLPVFQGLENPFVFLGDSLSLDVTAVNTVKTEVITLSATALPDGATFPSAVGTNGVRSTLTWNSPTAGVYRASFSATGDAGTRTASITLTVAGTARLAGYFYGWSGDTIFELDNGQFWQQSVTQSKTVSPALYRPTITITNVFGTRRMVVPGVSDPVAVRLLDVTESSVTNAFTGLSNGNLYQLADGTVWKQNQFETVASTADPVTAWRWMEDGRQKMRFVDRKNAEIGTCAVIAAAMPDDDTVRSLLDGYFRGWKSRRVFALQNGEFWQQTALDSSSQTLYQPAVTITNWLKTGSWRMSVEGQTGSVAVQKINARRTTVETWFYGFGQSRIFSLAGTNGWWQQTSSETSTSTRRSPDVLVWSQDGIDHLEMPDEGLSVTAIELDVQAENLVTNAFTGLHYGNLYRLDGAGDWMQLSFENVSTNVSQPEAMRWKDGTQTRMLLRDNRNRLIGTCIVADPEIDSDRDGQSNAMEMLAGANPLDEQSLFDVRQTGRSALSWDAAEGRIYTIEWAPSLTEPFQTLENQIAAPQNSWTDTVHRAETEGFYRISVRLAD
jgi:phosphatidylserine/phosphatidylglycerophosphate/cardiolipin synthase-like enzyme